MNALKAIAWYTYAVLATVLTIGLFIRFHLITVRKRELSGVRAGAYGCTHIYREDKFVVVSTWHGKSRYPVSQISYAATGPLRVKLQSTGGLMGKLATWQTRPVASFINLQVQVAAVGGA